MKMQSRPSERGGARLKLLLVVACLAVVGYTGYQFVPVFYQDYQLKDLMQHYVDTAVATGKPADWIKDQLIKSSADYGIPQNAVITPFQENEKMQVRVQFPQPIEFPGFTINYDFDYTAKSAAFLTIK
ncbi:MAG TPA: hypothetical protein VLL54_19520 [Pyrinomonadaceae bacterium]|nr:hypothetical protein [Pyrinomonadaceae bacterium]